MLGEKIEVVVGDIFDALSLTRAVDGVDAVHINLAAGTLNPKEIDRVEHLGTERVAKAAAAAKVKRISYLSGGHTSDKPILAPGPDQSMTSVAKSRAEHAIREGGVPYTMFRSTMYMEAVPTLIQGTTATLTGPMATSFHLLAAGDYAMQVSRGSSDNPFILLSDCFARIAVAKAHVGPPSTFGEQCSREGTAHAGKRRGVLTGPGLAPTDPEAPRRCPAQS